MSRRVAQCVLLGVAGLTSALWPTRAAAMTSGLRRPPATSAQADTGDDSSYDAPAPEPPASFRVVPEAVEVASFTRAAPAGTRSDWCVAVTRPASSAWEAAAADLKKELTTKLSRDPRVAKVRSTREYSMTDGRSDSEIAVQCARAAGGRYAVVVRFYPGSREQAPPQVTFALVDAGGTVLGTTTSVSVVVQRGAPEAKGMREVGKVLKQAQETAEGSVDEFKRRALRVQVLTTSWSSGRTSRKVEVLDGRGNELDLDDLAESTADDEIREKLSRMKRESYVERAFFFVPLGNCVGSPLAGAALGGFVGGCAGAGLGGLQLLGAGWVGALVTGVVMGVTGLGVGVVVGGGVGVAWGFVVVAVAWVANLIFSLTTTHLELGQYSFVVTEYNKRLARELKLNPSELDPEYFPLGR